jgi:hypothetical protein
MIRKAILLKSFALVAVVLLPALCSEAGAPGLEDISPHLPNDAQITWKAPTNDLPKNLWTYQKQPQSFSAAVVSNALALGGFRLTPFPNSFAKPISISDYAMEGDMCPDYFVVAPDTSTIICRREHHPVGQGDPTPDALLNRTWQYALRLGLDRALLVHKDNDSRVSLCRRIDGIAFQDESEGFSVQYGARGEILSFSLIWPRLERLGQERVISPDEIVRCIREFKTPLLPKHKERHYFERIKALSSLKSLTIIKITPYYSEGRYGEQPRDIERPKFIGPLAILDGIADWGSTNAAIQLFSPLLSSDADRLLSVKKPSDQKRP